MRSMLLAATALIAMSVPALADFTLDSRYTDADAGSGEAESPPPEPPEPPMPPASPPPVAYRVDGQPMCTDEWIMNEDHSWVPLVFEAKDGDLLSVETIHDICALDLEMRQRDGLCVALPHACPRAFRTARPHVHASTALSVCRAQ